MSLKRSILLTSLAVLAVCASSSLGAIRNVRTGSTYSTVQNAVNGAAAGDTIEIDSGTYTGGYGWATIYTNNLTIRGVGPTRPILDAAGTSPNDKGIFTVYANNITVQNLEMKNCVGPSNNDAGIRFQPQTANTPASLTVQNCYIHNNQDGVLTDGDNQIINGVPGGITISVLFDSCEFSQNGAGDGQSHNMYIGTITSFTLRYCYSHDAVVGHDVKTRAKTNYILYNLIATETSDASYELQICQGGTAYVIGNVILQGPNSQNSGIVSYGGDGSTNSNCNLYMVNNTLINQRVNGATFLAVNVPLVQGLFENNIVQWYGYETLISGYSSQVTQPTNWLTTNAGLANIANHDYHLTAASTGAINLGTAPGTGYNSYPLTPVNQYVHPLSYVARPTDSRIDIGAYEYVAANSPPTVNAGADQNVYEGAAVSLHATDSDPDGNQLTYTWTQPAGLNVALSGAATADASFTAPVVTTVAQAGMTFTATVSDGIAAPVSDSVNVHVWMRGDINRDNSVDALDLLAMAGAWDTTSSGRGNYNVQYDLNGDGTIDVVDLLILADNWGRILP